MKFQKGQDVLETFIERTLCLPYKWGGDDPIKGFDCSGYVIEAFKWLGYYIYDPKTKDAPSRDLPKHFAKYGCISKAIENEDDFKKFLKTPKYKLNLGDTIYYRSTKKREKIVHVAIALNNRFIVEAGGGGSSVVDEDTAAERNAYIRIQSILARRKTACLVVNSSKLVR